MNRFWKVIFEYSFPGRDIADIIHTEKVRFTEREAKDLAECYKDQFPMSKVYIQEYNITSEVIVK